MTVVFSDISGSTSLSQRLDPEVFRRVMSRYFEEMRAVLERHGGRVEKFIGDAVMAVFGIPTIHEDDALRAVRAAVDMRSALDRLNIELMEGAGVTMSLRTGVNTGEVVAGDPSAGTLVTGDAVNLAARLESAARPGEILIGNDTHRLVRDAVRAEPLEPLTLKGIGREVTAHRLLEVIPGAAGALRRMDAPLVGRDDDLSALQSAFETSVLGRSCRLVTILGSVGVGKSRLGLEFARQVEDDALVLQGRCLSYGEGRAMWPVAEVVKQAMVIRDDDTEEQARNKIQSFLAGEDDAGTIAREVSELIGLSGPRSGAGPGYRAVIDLFEALARRRPLVLIFDDIHWADSAFLDLVREIFEASEDAPILLLCVARSELLDHVPTWGEPEDGASTVTLAPLDDEECRRLLGFVLGRSTPTTEAQERIITAAEGNPLFLEEMLAMLIEEGLLQRSDGRYVLELDPSVIKVPPSIQALLAARLDRLGAIDRSIVEAATIVGEVFREDEVASLLPAAVNAGLGERLNALVAREFIRPETAGVAKSGSFRFHHTLVRDVAYEAIPKGRRAELHLRFADWLESSARAWSRWLQEALAYHLETAFWLRAELGPVDEKISSLAERAADQLGSAGRKAHAAHDMPAAANLMRRAVSIAPADHTGRLEMLPLFAEALVEIGEYEEAGTVVTEAIERARATGHRGVESHALIIMLKLPKRQGFTVSLGYGISGGGEVRKPGVD